MLNYLHYHLMLVIGGLLLLILGIGLDWFKFSVLRKKRKREVGFIWPPKLKRD